MSGVTHWSSHSCDGTGKKWSITKYVDTNTRGTVAHASATAMRVFIVAAGTPAAGPTPPPPGWVPARCYFVSGVTYSMDRAMPNRRQRKRSSRWKPASARYPMNPSTIPDANTHDKKSPGTMCCITQSPSFTMSRSPGNTAAPPALITMPVTMSHAPISMAGTLCVQLSLSLCSVVVKT